VEEAPVYDLFERPRHPYTEGLLRSVPKLTEGGLKRSRLQTIEGTVPNLLDLPPGCSFAPRCRYAIDECRVGEIPLEVIDGQRASRCIRHEVVGC
jgi:oligopeptide/dipeptide ABC transporter ATP-binding protein